MFARKMSRMALAVLCAASAHAAKAQNAAPPEGSGLQFFATERLWAARWDHRIIDAAVTAPPTATTPPEVTMTLRQRTASRIVPIQSVGLRYQGWIASASGWSGNFDFDGFIATGRSKRSEFDLTVGHSVMPGVVASLTYKQGKVQSAASPQAAALLNLTSRQKGNGLLLGLSAVAPLSPALSLYGSLAYGAGKYQVADEVPGNPKASARYVIGDFGAAYRIDTAGGTRAVDSVTIQLGYRTQVVSFRRLSPYAFPGDNRVKIVGRDEGKPQSTTDGVVLSVGLAF